MKLTMTEIKERLLDRNVELGYEPEDAQEIVEAARITTIENYCPDSPGYTGQIIFVVYSGACDIYEAFVVNKEDKSLVILPSQVPEMSA